jgi:Flp pilus assembly protein TadG
MYARTRKSSRPAGQFLQSLARDRGGNTLVMMAAFLVPLTVLAGSALDISRQFLVKSRLQQACDAGALAGRKFMTATSGTALDSNAATQATNFFNSNFRSGWMGASNVTFTPVRTTDAEVQATATATVPMTITRVFSSANAALSVNCTARFDIGDTDIMFVLDTTGSMADATSGCSSSGTSSYTRPDGTTGYKRNECTGTYPSKISGLRSAVLTFYDTLTAHSSAQTHIRYGFVTYTSTVNAGYLLPSNYIVDSWTYQTRKLGAASSPISGDPVTSDVTNGSSTNSTSSPGSSAACTALGGRTPTTGYNTDGSATFKTTSWNSTTSVCTVTSQPVKPNWTYGAFAYDTSQFKLGNTVTDPSKITAATSKWQGCLEERDTTASSTFNQSSLPYDLDPDLVPTNNATKWRPMWPDVIYFRDSDQTTGNTINNSGSSSSVYGDTSTTSTTGQYTNMISNNNMSSGYVSCGKPAQRLATMTRTQVSNYVNATDFVAQGGTYHDTGMIWGTRLLSPTGIFAADTTAWPGRTTPARYIIFMTDGNMAPNEDIYGMYGMEYYDKRVTGGTTSNMTTNHNARFLASCTAAKYRGIQIYVVGFGQTLTTELTNCASPGNAFYASDNATLTSAFSQIALNVAALRLTR